MARARTATFERVDVMESWLARRLAGGSIARLDVSAVIDARLARFGAHGLGAAFGMTPIFCPKISLIPASPTCL